MTPMLPLVRSAQEWLDDLSRMAGGRTFPDAAALLAERARINRYATPGLISAGGGCRFYRTADGWVALNLAREADRELLPALFGEDIADIHTAFARHSEPEIVARGRVLGLAIAGLQERATSPARMQTAESRGMARRQGSGRRVLDLSALWAGPLASRLLRRAGFDVTRIESVGREDPLHHSDPLHYSALNAGKRPLRLNLRSPDGRRELIEQIAQADIVIEAARPRALLQLGIDADAIVRGRSDLTWITITGHGVANSAADWVAFGDDAGVAGGLSRELWAASGTVGFVGDAIADPLTGIAAANAALSQFHKQQGGRIVLSMSGTVTEAIAREKHGRAKDLTQSLLHYAARVGQPLAEETVPC